jgi:protein phosphatase 1 regulatory subunit 37
MRNLAHIMRGMAAASALMLATPVLAGEDKRAIAAIAEAQGKIDAARNVKAGEVVPESVANAEASLRIARDELKNGNERRALRAAVDAQRLADIAIARAQRDADLTAQAQATTANVAQQQAADAAQQAADANARATAAERAAASAAADAAAARATPSVTTVTTESVKASTPTRTASKAPVKKRTTARRTTTTAPAVTERTTTIVTAQ